MEKKLKEVFRWYEFPDKERISFFTDLETIRVETENGESICIIANLSNVEISSRLGNTPRTIKFTNNAQFVTSDNNGVDQYLVKHRLKSGSLIYTLESHLGLVTVATVFTVVFLGIFIWKGLPAISKTIATQLPERIVAETGHGSLELLEQILA